MGLQILLAEKHTLFRDAMRSLLPQLGDGISILEAANYRRALELVASTPRMDMVLMDLNLPGGKGMDMVLHFHQLYPSVPLVVILEVACQDDMERAMESGACGCISKTSSGKAVLSSLRLVLDLPPMSIRLEEAMADKRKRRFGQNVLTARQMEVLQHLGAGLSNKEISQKLGLSLGTTKVHIAAIYKSLNVSNRLEVLNAAQRFALLP